MLYFYKEILFKYSIYICDMLLVYRVIFKVNYLFNYYKIQNPRSSTLKYNCFIIINNY